MESRAMPETLDVIVPVRRISPPHGHFFFGYYDLPAADAAGRHLFHQVEFRERFPRPDDVARLGYISLAGGESKASELPCQVFSETRAWNFQQGAMLQWLGSEPDTCLYNVFEDGSYGACIHNVRTGDRRTLPRPVANVSRDGTRALAINMSRVFDFRPGYGYEELPDPYASIPAPEEDGVFLMDLQTGAHRLILSYAQMADFLRAAGELPEERKLVVNHLTFNPSATRFLFLVRTFPTRPGEGWTTFLLTADREGQGLRHHPTWGMASHYHWRNDTEMLFWMNTAPEGRPALVVVDDPSGEKTPVDPDYFRHDGHCSYSPDGRWILYDGYPDPSTPDYLRALMVYSLERREGFLLGRFRSETWTPDTVDLRCDLHPRWMPDGRSVTFDSIHEGYRGIYWMDLRYVLG